MPIDYFKENNIKFSIFKSSYKQLNLEYEVPVYSVGPLKCVDNFKIKLMYELLDSSNSESTIWKLFDTKDFYKKKISSKWKIKSSLITTNLSASLVEVDGYVLSGFITSFVFSDRTWSRDYLIDKLLKNKKNIQS